MKKATFVSYKTVLVHIDESVGIADRIGMAAAIARIEEGHLIGVALTGLSRFLYQSAAAGEPDPNLALHLSLLREKAGRALNGFAAQASALGVRSFEQRVVDDEAGGGVSLLARCADLVVIGQINPQQPSKSVMADFPAYVALHCARPLLIVPHTETAREQAPPRHILICWNGSKEASRAASAAIPLLKRADRVHLAVFDTNEGGAEPGAAIARYLERHGVACSMVQGPDQRLGRSADIGAALLAQAEALGCDLLVMGAYGHSRFRETILGGVTRTILREATLPVLMVH